MSSMMMIPAAEVTAMRETMETLRAELAALRSQQAKKAKTAKEPKGSCSSSPGEGAEGGTKKEHDGRSDWMAAIKKTWQELAAAKGVETEGDYAVFKKAAAAAGVTYQVAMAEASRRKAEVEPRAEAPKEAKEPKAPKEPKAQKAPKTPEEKAKKTTNPEGPAHWNAFITATWHDMAAAAGVVSEAHDEAFKKAATAAGISFGVARDEASRRRKAEMEQPAEPKAVKAPKAAKAPKEAKPYVPYVADDEDDASSTDATPGAATRELFEPSPQAGFPHHSTWPANPPEVKATEAQLDAADQVLAASEEGYMEAMERIMPIQMDREARPCFLRGQVGWFIESSREVFSYSMEQRLGTWVISPRGWVFAPDAYGQGTWNETPRGWVFSHDVREKED